jgi:hypothetical protein
MYYFAQQALYLVVPRRRAERLLPCAMAANIFGLCCVVIDSGPH